MKTLSTMAIIAFLCLAEDSIVSDLSQFGDVRSIHVDQNFANALADAVADINVNSLSVNDWSHVVNAANKIVNVSVDPIKKYGREICQYANEMALVNAE